MSYYMLFSDHYESKENIKVYHEELKEKSTKESYLSSPKLPQTMKRNCWDYPNNEENYANYSP